MAILGLDVSHFQSVNFAQVKASGRSFVVLKATEGVGYTDPTFAARRQQAHAAGLIVGFYHFARAGDAVAESAYFLQTVGPLQPGEFLVLDWEVPASNPVGWCRTWLDHVYADTGVRPMIYMNSSAMNGSNWLPVAAVYGLWLAKYDNSTAQPAVTWWAAAAMKQYGDAVPVPGVGPCDVDVFYGSAAQLLAYGKGGSPAPVSTEDEVGVLRTPDGTIWLATSYSLESTADPTTASAWQKAYGPYVDATAAEIAALDTNVRARVPDLARAMQVETILKQLCGDGATIEQPWPGADKGGGWPLTPPDPSVQRYTPVMFQQAILAEVQKLLAGGAAVDAQAVIGGVLAGLDGARLNVQQPSS